MTDKLKQHRIIGIRHALKEFKGAGLVEEESLYPTEAVTNVQNEILSVAQTWYEIGAKRGALEIIDALLEGKFEVNSDKSGERKIIANVNSISWKRRLKVTVGNEKHAIDKQKYILTIKDLDFDVE